MRRSTRLTRERGTIDKPHLGGITAVVVFVAVLLAFTVQSDLTTYVQSQLHFRQPYFIL